MARFENRKPKAETHTRDPDAENEQRFVLIGLSNSNRLLTVCYALPDDETVRIISARKATAKERAAYA